MCPPFFFSMSLIPSYEWPEAKCLSFFSIVVISLDTKNKVLKVFCIWLHTWRKESFHQIVSLYYLRKLTRQIIVKRLTLLVKKDLTHIGIITKLCIMQLFGWHAWMFKMSVSSCYMFVSVLKSLLNLPCCQHRTYHRMFVGPNNGNTMQPCHCISKMTTCNF